MQDGTNSMANMLLLWKRLSDKSGEELFREEGENDLKKRWNVYFNCFVLSTLKRNILSKKKIFEKDTWAYVKQDKNITGIESLQDVTCKPARSLAAI